MARGLEIGGIDVLLTVNVTLDHSWIVRAEWGTCWSLIERAPTAGGFVECQLTISVETFDVLSTFCVCDLTGSG